MFNGLTARQVLASSPRLSLRWESWWLYIITGYSYPEKRGNTVSAWPLDPLVPTK